MADAAAPLTTGVSKTPAEFLKAIKGKPVLVKLNSGVDYKGEKRAACTIHHGYGCIASMVCVHKLHAWAA